MTREEYREQLGGVVGNLHALEFALRAFLQTLPTARPFGAPDGTDLYSLPVGAEAPENELTSYDSLSILITKFNAEMQRRGRPRIDASLVDLRDAIAHGRVSAQSKNGYLRLLKFERPMNGRVRVAFNAEMNEAWFEAQTRRTWEAIELVVAQTTGGSIEP